MTKRTAIVTGAARGIGHAIAERLGEAGAQLVLVDLDDAALQRAADELRDKGLGVEAIAADISSRKDVCDAVRLAVERFGRVDALAATAGTADLEPLLEIDDAHWGRMLDVNLTGTFICVQETARAMLATGGGSIVCIASTNAFYPEAHTAHYSATKGGIVALVKAAALDLGQHGIRINALNPGIIRTRLSEVLTEDPVGGPDYLRRVPLGRFGEPRDIANAALFLLSDEASYVTGEAMTVDGGATVGVTLDVPDEALPGSLRDAGSQS